MIHFHKPKSTFIHIMKTGGSSFTYWVNLHLDEEKYKNYKNPNTHITREQSLEFESDLGQVFTIVRNPFDRLVSLYTFLHRKPGPISKRIKTFEYFVKQSCEQGNFHKFILKRVDPINQYDMIGSDDCMFLKLENITEDFKKIQEMFKINEPFPHRNKTKHKPYRSMYSDQLRDMVTQACETDLKKFNYSF